MLKNAQTPALVKKTIEKVWREFDKDGNGVLDAKEAKKFVDVILKTMFGQGKYNLAKFNQWFNEFDRDHSGAIEKSEFVNFITKVARTEQFGPKDVSAY